jgi:predicted nucleic acid-binding protein
MPNKFWVDTNIFIRFYRQDDPKLSPLAQEIIADCIAGKYHLVICSVTILEIVWLLHSLYKLPRQEIITFVENIFVLCNLEIVDKEIAQKTFALFKEKNIDAADAYFAALMDQEKITEIFSFDHDLNKIPHLHRLQKPK